MATVHEAAENGDCDGVPGAEVDDTDSKFDTPLHVACKRGQTNTARVLAKELGAEVNLENIKGETPLHLASWNGCIDTVRAVALPYNSRNLLAITSTGRNVYELDAPLSEPTKLRPRNMSARLAIVDQVVQHISSADRASKRAVSFVVGCAWFGSAPLSISRLMMSAL